MRPWEINRTSNGFISYICYDPLLYSPSNTIKHVFFIILFYSNILLYRLLAFGNNKTPFILYTVKQIDI